MKGYKNGYQGIILLVIRVQGLTSAAVLLAIIHGNKKANRILYIKV